MWYLSSARSLVHLGILSVLGLSTLECSPPVTPRIASFVVDLRQQQDEGAVVVRAEIIGDWQDPILISSFVQPAAIRVAYMTARRAELPLTVRNSLDSRGFGRWSIEQQRTLPGLTEIEYVVRPGGLEESKISGPTGYRFGYLDRTFGTFSGRQLFLLPAEPELPLVIRIRFVLPERWKIISPWK